MEKSIAAFAREITGKENCIRTAKSAVEGKKINVYDLIAFFLILAEIYTPNLYIMRDQMLDEFCCELFSLALIPIYTAFPVWCENQFSNSIAHGVPRFLSLYNVSRGKKTRA